MTVVILLPRGVTWRQQCGGGVPALLAALWLVTSHPTSAHSFPPGCTKVWFGPHRLPVPPTGTWTKHLLGGSHCSEPLAKLFCGLGYDETNTAPGIFLMESPPWICGQRDAYISHRTLFSGPLCPLSSRAPLHGICVGLSTSRRAQRVKNIS